MDDSRSGLALGGVLAALTTPFVRGRVSAERLRDNLSRYETTDLTGYLVLGSTGEAVLLDEDERRVVLEAARSAIPPGKPMIAGVSAEATRAAEEQIRVAAGCSADAVLVSTPHYFRAQMTHEILVAHFSRIADRSPIPLLLYNVPKFTGFILPPSTVAALSRHGNIAGIKESSGELDYLSRIRDQVPEEFLIVCGAAGVLLEAIAGGAQAAILAAASAVPEPFAAIARAAETDEPAARSLHRQVMEARSVGGSAYGVPGIKAAMDLRGLYGGAPRRPLAGVAPSVALEIEQVLLGWVQAGLIRDRWA
jgi:4-hydroxy-2-oxoglutarate aldolase